MYTMNIRLLFIILLSLFVSSSLARAEEIDIQKKITALKKDLTKVKGEEKKVDLLNKLSRYEMQEGDCKTALLHAKQAEGIAKKCKYAKGVTYSYISLVAAFRICGDEKQFLLYREKSIERLKKNPNVNDEAFLYSQIGDYYFGKTQNDKAIKHLKKAIYLSKKVGDLLLEANTSYLLGDVYSREFKYTDAAECYSHSLEIYKKIDYTSRIALAAGNAGLLNYLLGKRPEALTYCVFALEKYEEANNFAGIAWMCGMLGNTYRSIKDYDKALIYFHKGLESNKKAGQKLDEGDSYLLLAGLYIQKKDFKKANENLDKASLIYEEAQDEVGIYGVHGERGSNYFEEKKYDLALEPLNKSIEYFKKIGDHRRVILSEQLIGAIYIETGKIKEGEEILYSVLEHFYKNNEKHNFPFVYRFLVKADSLKGDYKSAFEHYKNLIEYRELAKNSTGDTENFSIRYEFEKKEAVAKEALKNKNLQRNAAIIGLILMLIILIIVFYLFRLRNRSIKIEKENSKLSKREVERIVETERFKSRFLANISHEFRTPLTLINGHLEVLEENGREEDLFHFQEMKSNGKQLLQLINQLLELSKMESNSYALKYQSGFVLNETKAFVEAFHSLSEQKNIQLEFHQKSEQLEKFVYSQDALSIIVSNLLSNAFKFTPEGGKITVDVGIKDDLFILKITDSGIGIAREHLPYIFDRFFQVDEPTNRTYEGSGIGLALVKELALLHGGDVTVDSSIENGGCTFFVQLKNALNEEYVEERETKIDPIQFVDKQIHLSSQNEELPLILVVEDQTELRRFVIENLGQEYRFSEAKNGSEGIRLAEELIPDLIISDIMMPDTDGLVLCKTLKGNISTSHIPIMLLTAKADQSDKILGLETGADDYLIKPFSLAEIKLRVRNILRTRQLLRQKFEGISIPTPDELPLKDREFLTKVNEIIQNHLSDQQFGVSELADKLFFSVSKLNRKMKSLTGSTPADYIRNIRLQKAVEFLKDGLTVSETGWEIGFDDAVYFSKVFKKRFGYPPSHVNKPDLNKE